MKKFTSNLIMYFLALLLISQVSCTDESPDLPENIGQFDTEVFPDLTAKDLSKIETPYEDLLQSAIGARIKNDGSKDAIVEELMKILAGAKIIDISDEEERGLAVNEIEILLANGAKLEIVLVKEVYEILEIEGQSGPFDYDFDPEASFISLQEAFQLAKTELDGEIVRWELELEEDNKWEFEVIIKNEAGKFEVEIDAFAGTIIEINQIDEDDDEDFEEEDETAPDNILAAVAEMIDGEVIHVEKEEEKEAIYWEIKVKTTSGAFVKIVINNETEDLIYAKGDEGPFDYDLNPGEGFKSLEDVIEVATNEFAGDVYYWYFETPYGQENVDWAYFVKIKGEQGYTKFGINAHTGEIFLEEFFD